VHLENSIHNIKQKKTHSERLCNLKYQLQIRKSKVTVTHYKQQENSDHLTTDIISPKNA